LVATSDSSVALSLSKGCLCVGNGAEREGQPFDKLRATYVFQLEEIMNQASNREKPMGDFVQIEIHDKVAVLRLNSPDSLNAIATHQDCDDLVSAIESVGENRAISVIILTGNGRAFCAGGNLKAMKERSGIGPMDQPDSTRSNYRRGVQRITRAMLEVEVPMIAAINGHAVGLGCDLACLCDMRIAAQSALFACSFIKVGIVPGDGGAWSLQRVVGYAMAAELFFTGDRFDAARAKELGLVSRVVPDADLMDEAFALAARITCNPPRALRLTKRLLREAQTARMSEILELSAAYQALAHETADHAEAVDAFLEKRAPVFTGD
jgi:2-(1,2-epoxy-1,2-dihydrophenyl)acetyl-CoA isomerase